MITGIELRRRFTDEQKARFVAETLKPGVSIIAVANRHKLAPRLLYLWRSRLKKAGLTPVRQVDAADAFVQAATVRAAADAVVRVHFQDPLVIDFPVGIPPRQIAEILRSLRA